MIHFLASSNSCVPGVKNSSSFYMDSLDEHHCCTINVSLVLFLTSSSSLSDSDSGDISLPSNIDK